MFVHLLLCPGSDAKYTNEHVRVSVCMHISKATYHVPSFTKFTIRVAWASSSTEDSAMHYVLPVLWMTSCSHIMLTVGQKQRRHYVSFSLPGGSTDGEVAVYDCLILTLLFNIHHLHASTHMCHSSNYALWFAFCTVFVGLLTTMACALKYMIVV